MSAGLTTASITPLRAPSKAQNLAPGDLPILTGAPVMASCSAASSYILNSSSAEAGNMIV
jgi:hypothetical protein